MKLSVILPAAGLGTQHGREKPASRKQFMLLEGSPILLHTIRKFAAFPPVSEIVVALRADDWNGFADLLGPRGVLEARAVGGGWRIAPTVG